MSTILSRNPHLLLSTASPLSTLKYSKIQLMAPKTTHFINYCVAVVRPLVYSNNEFTGKRLFKLWLCHPLCNVAQVNERLDSVDDLNSLSGVKCRLIELLKKLPDIERLLSRIHAGNCKISEFRKVLGCLQSILTEMADLKEYSVQFHSKRLSQIFESMPYQELDRLHEISEMLNKENLGKSHD